MATLRRTFVIGILTVACSGVDPSPQATDLEGVMAIDDVSCNGDCPEAEIAGAAVAQGSVWVTRLEQLTHCDGQCFVTQQAVSLARTAFDDAGVTQVAATPNYTGSGAFLSSGVDVAADGTRYFAHMDPTGHVVVDGLTPTGADAGSVTELGTGHVVGVAEDNGGAIIAVTNEDVTNRSNDDSSDQGQFVIHNTGNNISTNGAIFRVDLHGGATTRLPGAATFATSLSAHLFATDATNIYWASTTTVYSASRDLSQAATGQAISAGCPGTLNVCDPVGLVAANGSVFAAVLRGQSNYQCNNGPCSGMFTSSGCKIIELPSRVVYDDPKTACMGLAVDGTDAYFAVIEQTSADQCCSDDGGAQPVTYIKTTGIARVPIAGPTATTPAAVFPIATNRFYGPRRFFVDATHVYGIDPAYVFRIAKSAIK